MPPYDPTASTTIGPHRIFEKLSTSERMTLLDIMANTDCSYYAALAVMALWDSMGIRANRQAFDSGEIDRSVKVGLYDGGDEPIFITTILS